MLSFTTSIDAEVISACPNIKYIGMCCSLYDPKSANVDVSFAIEKGIVVSGARDYGDEGVGEFVISELVRLLHGRRGPMWKDEPTEITGLKVGIVGMGVVGTLVAKTLKYFNANVFYYSRTRKTTLENENNYKYLPLDELLGKVDILVTCLNKNVVVLGEKEFELFGNNKILVNTSISPSHEISALKKWLKNKKNYVLCDTIAGLGKEIEGEENALYGTTSAGLTSLAKDRLGEKVLNNIKSFENLL